MKWYNWINEVLSGVGIVLGIDISSTKDVLGLILVILNIAVLVISLIIKIITWFKEAKKDGKITNEEIKDVLDILSGGIDDINKHIEDSKPQKEKNDNE